MDEDYQPIYGRPPMPVHRVKHGTPKGYRWHKRMTVKDPDHVTCSRCRDAWNKHYAKYRRELRRRKRAGEPIQRQRKRRKP